MHTQQQSHPVRTIFGGNTQRRLSRPSAMHVASLVTCALSIAALLTAPQPARATITVGGITYAYFNDPINGLTYGLPFTGNDVDYDPNPPTNAQFFEYNSVQGPANTTGPNEIIVGKGARGDLSITAGSILRAEDLIVGDITTVAGVPRPGLGLVRITGIGATGAGSTFNNDPGITALHPSVIGTSWTTIRNNTGNRLILGRGNGSNGQLDVTAGGNVEIQDAVIIAQDPFSTGLLNVDGSSSSFTSGGFPGGVATDFHLLIVGLRGTGIMRITTGATVQSEAQPGGNGVDLNFGATIGARPAAGGSEPGLPGLEGGQGTVEVIGPASKWLIGGSLQIGGFHHTQGPLGQVDAIGNTVIYGTNSGVGTLNVDLGGLVNIRPAIDPNPQDTLALAIGRFGNLNLNGGYLNVGIPGLRTFRDLVTNDGTIRGGGRIDTGIFHNRYFGEVIVDGGQTLTIASSADLDDNAVTTIDPLSNYGLIEVTGEIDLRAELIIERAPPTTTATIARPFINQLLPQASLPDPPASRGGLITAEHATLRFESGLLNESQLAFTAGTNIVSGDVMNIGPADVVSPDDSEDTGDFTNLTVTGPDTVVIFQDMLGNSGGADITVENGGNIVVQQDLAIDVQSELTIELSRDFPSSITVMGDLGLTDAEFNLKLANDVFPLQHGDTFELISFGGNIGGVDSTTDPLRPVPDLSILPSILDQSVSPNLNLSNPELVLVIQLDAPDGVYAQFLDPALVGPPGGPGAIAPDFNGDGVIDLADIAIWQTYEGCESGCNVLTGDADGDGDVDGDDLAFILRNLGQPPPWAGSGSGSGGGALGGSVPEPTSLGLFAAAMLALALRRGQHPKR
jgi:hypothetical protein